LNHSPRSINRQRSLQKGRHLDSGTQGTGLPQLGQATVLGILSTGMTAENQDQKAQQVREKVVSSRQGIGCPVSCMLMKRIQKRFL